MLREMEADILAHPPSTRVTGAIELPVKLRVHSSVFVPLAKWAMLLTGNYRCVTPDGPRAIRDAVHSDLEASAEVYAWVRSALHVTMGADGGRTWCRSRNMPMRRAGWSSRPRPPGRSMAVLRYIERVDKMVQILGAQRDMRHPVVDETVRLVDAQLEKNRAG